MMHPKTPTVLIFKNVHNVILKIYFAVEHKFDRF